jgi:iron transport multicopper oxidase
MHIHTFAPSQVHGMIQARTSYNDGAVGFSQGPLEPGQSYNYTFKAYPTGTTFYHGHFMENMASGNRGMNIVRKRPCDDPYA